MQCLPISLQKCIFKGTVAWDFSPPFFSSKLHTLDPDSYPKFFSNLVSNSPSYLNLNLTLRCIMQRGVKSLRCIMQQKTKILGKISPLQHAAGSQISPLHHAAGSQISPQHNTAGSQISPLHDAAGSRYWQRGVKSKMFWGLPKTLKEQWGKKWHMMQLNYPISIRIIHENSLSSIFFCWLPAAWCSRESNSKSNNSANLKPK